LGGRVVKKTSFNIPESPALLHGDLWSGNFSSQSNGLPIIYDPAVSYGHREMDLAMTRLFGGFDSAFMMPTSTPSTPVRMGRRLEIANSILLVHLNLFGGHYLREVLQS
jgi:fructosamine-3-kinase